MMAYVSPAVSASKGNPMAHPIAVIVGSLRKESFTLKIANALAKLAPASLKLDVVTLNGISFFNQDLEAAPPADWVAFREKIQKSDGVIFVTPEYNRAISGVLKNAIDVASRPYGANCWDGKPAAIVSGSPGAIGGFGSNHHLRQSLVFLNMPAMAQPEAYIGHADKLFDENGKLTNDGTAKFLGTFLEAFGKWIAMISA
jgi:chromate reductase, NAD(P)H dehydrogenase (quinone)